MKRNSFFRFNDNAVLIVCIIGLFACFQNSVQADILCSTGTETGFANESGGFDDNSSPPASFTIDLTGLGTDAAADGSLDLTTFGDFSNAFEYIDICIEGDDFGRLWDNDTSNDSFTGNVLDNDRGQEYGTSPSGEVTNSNAIASLSESQLDAYLADDGIVTITFKAFGAQVNNLENATDEFITAKVTINDAAAVPEPSGCLILTFAFITIGAVRRRST